MKLTIALLFLVIFFAKPSQGQVKEAFQMSTLTPTMIVLSSSDVIRPHKLHYTVSTILHLSSYMVTDSQWKAIVISLMIGAAKELIHDGLMNRGEPWIQDMKWNALGVAQGTLFTLSLKL